MFSIRVWLLAVAMALLSASSRAQASFDKPRVLLVSIDGLDARYIRDRDKLGLKVPNLRRLLANGTHARGMRSVYPSVTYPNHTSAVTGAYPAKHRIVANVLFEPPDQRKKSAAFWYAHYIKADTLWDAAKRNRLSVGLVSWPVAGGAGDWNWPEMWRPGGTWQERRDASREQAIPAGLVKEVAQAVPHIYAMDNEDEGDNARTHFAEYILEKKKPALMLVHLYDLDHFEHEAGPFTAQAHAILEKTDGYIGRLLKALERAGTAKNTTVFIMADHGFYPYDRYFHPAALLASAGLVEMTMEERNGWRKYKIKSWRAYPYNTSASCAIMLRDPNDTEAAQKLREIFEPIASDPKGPLFRILYPPDLKKLHSNTTAAMVLEPASGFSCGSSLGPEFITASKNKGNHGYLPTRPEYMAAFIAAGAGVKRGESGEINMVDVAPTVAKILGLTLKDSVGKPVALD